MVVAPSLRAAKDRLIFPIHRLVVPSRVPHNVEYEGVQWFRSVVGDLTEAAFEFRTVPKNSSVSLLMRPSSSSDGTKNIQELWMGLSIKSSLGRRPDSPSPSYKFYATKTRNSVKASVYCGLGSVFLCKPDGLMWFFAPPVLHRPTLRNPSTSQCVVPSTDKFLNLNEKSSSSAEESLESKLRSMLSHPDLSWRTWQQWIVDSRSSDHHRRARNAMAQLIALGPFRDLQFCNHHLVPTTAVKNDKKLVIRTNYTAEDTIHRDIFKLGRHPTRGASVPYRYNVPEDHFDFVVFLCCDTTDAAKIRRLGILSWCLLYERGYLTDVDEDIVGRAQVSVSRDVQWSDSSPLRGLEHHFLDLETATEADLDEFVDRNFGFSTSLSVSQ